MVGSGQLAAGHIQRMVQVGVIQGEETGGIHERTRVGKPVIEQKADPRRVNLGIARQKATGQPATDQVRHHQQQFDPHRARDQASQLAPQTAAVDVKHPAHDRQHAGGREYPRGQFEHVAQD
jgi:hypothetical protein